MLRENKYNYVKIKIPLGEFLNSVQGQNIGKGYSLDLPCVYKLKISEFSNELLKTFRGLLWDIQKNSSFAFHNPSDFELEILSFQRMIAILEKKYSEYFTSIEEDREILKKAEGKLYFAVIFK